MTSKKRITCWSWRRVRMCPQLRRRAAIGRRCDVRGGRCGEQEQGAGAQCQGFQDLDLRIGTGARPARGPLVSLAAKYSQ